MKKEEISNSKIEYVGQKMSVDDIKDYDFTEFKRQLSDLINRHSLENLCDTPDYLLAQYMVASLKELALTIKLNIIMKGIENETN